MVKDFDQFPHAREHLRVRDPKNFPGHPAYRFWFVRRNGQAQICLETSGWAWAADGTAYELMALYRQARRIWPIISRIAGPVLP